MKLLTEGIPYLLDPTIELDQVTVVVGANASGKSTLLRAIESCLRPPTLEEEATIESLPTLLASPVEVDDEVLNLAYGSVTGIYNDWRSVSWDIENFHQNFGTTWNTEIRDADFLSDEQWLEQLPRLTTTGVSLALFQEIYLRNREKDILWLRDLCRSLESAFVIGFHRGRVGVMIAVEELMRRRDAFNLILLEPDVNVTGTMLQSLARASTTESMDPKSYVWLQDPEYHLASRDDVTKQYSSSPLFLAYERSGDSGLNETIERAVAKYLLEVFRELRPDESSVLSELASQDTLVSLDFGWASLEALEEFVGSVPDVPGLGLDSLPLEDQREFFEWTLREVPEVRRGSKSAAVLARTDLEEWLDDVNRRLVFGVADLAELKGKPFLDFVVSQLERQANSLAPSFVRDEGVIRVKVEAQAHEQQVPVFFETAASRIPLHLCSDGIRKYVTIALQLALHQIQQGTVFRCEVRLSSEVDRHFRAMQKLYERWMGGALDGELRGDKDPARLGLLQEPHIRVPVRSGGDQVAEDFLEVTFVEFPSRPVLLLDEPENHLHPMACRSVRSWIEELSSEFMLVAVATHNPVIMDVSPDFARLLVAEKRSDGARISAKHHNALHQQKVLIDQMGLTKSDLLLMSSYVLFVEGIHDKIVLETWFGSELRRAGVLVFPLHGLGKANRLPDAELVWELGKRTGILLDDLDPELALDANKVVDKSSTEHVTREVLEKWRVAGRQPDVFGLSRKDILFYIDSEAVREHSREFDTWEDAYERAVRAGRSSSRQWKKFVSDEFGVDVSDGGEQSIREMCQTALEMELRPAELKSIVDNVIWSATSGRAPGRSS